MAKPIKTGTMRPLISRTIHASEIPGTAKRMAARDEGMYPRLLRKVQALRRDQAEEVEFESETQAIQVCSKLRHYAKKAKLEIEMSRQGKICFFKKAAVS